MTEGELRRLRCAVCREPLDGTGRLEWKTPAYFSDQQSSVRVGHRLCLPDAPTHEGLLWNNQLVLGTLVPHPVRWLMWQLVRNGWGGAARERLLFVFQDLLDLSRRELLEQIELERVVAVLAGRTLPTRAKSAVAQEKK